MTNVTSLPLHGSLAVSSVVLTWEASTYTGSLDAYEDEPVIKGYIMAEVMETNETIATEVSLFFQYPQLTLEVSWQPGAGGLSWALVGDAGVSSRVSPGSCGMDGGQRRGSGGLLAQLRRLECLLGPG